MHSLRLGVLAEPDGLRWRPRSWWSSTEDLGPACRIGVLLQPWRVGVSQLMVDWKDSLRRELEWLAFRSTLDAVPGKVVVLATYCGLAVDKT